MGIFGRSKVSAGLDVGSGYVKLVVMDHSTPEPEITRIAMSPLVPDAIVDGEVMDPVLVAETVRSVIENAGLGKAVVVAAVGGHDVIIKKISMDRVAEADARDLIRWEAEQHVPFDMESVQLDFQILDPDGRSPQMSVLLVAAKRDVIETKLALLAEAGLTPAIIDVDAFALHNAFERNYPEAMNGLIAVVNVGHETTNVNLLQDGAPALVRDLPFGSRRIREALQRERGLMADEADAAVQGRAAGLDLRSFVADRVDELALGIERAVAFVTTQTGGPELDRVFVSGGGARVPGLVEALGLRLGLRSELVNPMQRLRIHPDVVQSMDLDKLAPMLLLPVGLALRQPN